MCNSTGSSITFHRKPLSVIADNKRYTSITQWCQSLSVSESVMSMIMCLWRFSDQLLEGTVFLRKNSIFSFIIFTLKYNFFSVLTFTELFTWGSGFLWTGGQKDYDVRAEQQFPVLHAVQAFPVSLCRLTLLDEAYI